MICLLDEGSDAVLTALLEEDGRRDFEVLCRHDADAPAGKHLWADAVGDNAVGSRPCEEVLYGVHGSLSEC